MVNEYSARDIKKYAEQKTTIGSDTGKGKGCDELSVMNKRRK
jgi:hypothetical protein